MWESLERLLLPVYRQLASQYRRIYSTEAIFKRVYSRNEWGGKAGEFYSGAGSHDADLVTSYVDLVHALLAKESQPHLVDLGCGDFNIGSHLTDLCGSYTGVDIVPELVDYNNLHHGSDAVRFVRCDLTKEPLPQGDVALLRQVLQHLSNDQIGSILPRLSIYKWVLITEHHLGPEPNREKSHGAPIRVGSGVFLDQPPFNIPPVNIPPERLRQVSEITPVAQQGILRSYIYTPASTYEPSVPSSQQSP